MVEPITHFAATRVHSGLAGALRGPEGQVLSSSEIRRLYGEATGRSPSVVPGSDHHAQALNRGRCAHCTDGVGALLERVARGRYRVLAAPPV